MNLVYQNLKPREDRVGDCFPACVATMLDMKIEDVPAFFLRLTNGSEVTSETSHAMQAWFHDRGLHYLEVSHKLQLRDLFEMMATLHPGLTFILTGRNGANLYHSIVASAMFAGGHAAATVHDPAVRPRPGDQPKMTISKPDNHGCYRIGLFCKYVRWSI